VSARHQIVAAAAVAGCALLVPAWACAGPGAASPGATSPSAAAAPPGWQGERRLTADPGASQLAINFARAVAAEPGGSVHVVWFDQAASSSRILYRRSTDGGRAWKRAVQLSPRGAWAERPAVAVSGGQLYVVWHARSSQGYDVFLRRSTNGGASWSAPRALSSSHAAAYPAVAATGAAVHVSWGDSRSGHAELVTRRSGDRGATWSAEQQLSPPGFDSWVPTIEADGERVVAAWVDTGDGNEEEYLRRSLDGGRSWQPVQRITANDRNSWAPSVVVAGDVVHFAWFDQQDAPFSPYEAETPLHEAMRLLGLEVPPLPAGVMVPHPMEAARRRTTEKAHLVEAAAPAWIAAGGDAARLAAILAELQAMGARGASYLEKERKIDEAVRLLGLTYVPGPMDDVPRVYYGEAQQIRVQDELLQVRAAGPAWVAAGGDPARLEALLAELARRMRLATHEWEIYYRRSLDGGATFEPTQRLTFAGGFSQRPSLAVDGRAVQLVWFDERDGDVEVYTKRSADGGVTWGPDVRLSTARGTSELPSLAVGAGVAHVVWSDDRTGNREIFYTRSVP
jgi:hypothetical protein